MSLETNSFKFGEFLLDAKEKVLMRDGKPLSITPKAFQLLQILVENHGHLVEREELINKIWADSFVEEGNLTVTIRFLRKLLDDSKQNPRFIETVSKRGYRFIANAEKISPADEPEKLPQPTISLITENVAAADDSRKAKKISIPFIVVLIGLIGTVAISSWYLQNKNYEPNAPVLSAPFASEKLSTNGKVFHAILSPDGKNVVYTNGIEGKQSVWLRQLESGSNIEIIPSSDVVYAGLAFSPDGNTLYFTRRPRFVEGQVDIYRVSIFGGVPQKIIGETQGSMSLSPDGTKISFVRCYYRKDEYCSLWIADTDDGKNEKKLVSRPSPVRIRGNKISPDGKSVVFAVGQSENSANEFSLMKVDIESGAETEITKEKFFDIRNLVWLPDKSGLLITARKNTDNNFRIWLASTATGKTSPLTKDSETYGALSLDKDANRLVSTQIKPDFRLRLFNLENPLNNSTQVDAMEVAFAPNGKILVSSPLSGNYEIWSLNADGSGQRQLTNDAAKDVKPIISPDNNSIFFASNRSGAAHVWRMSADGSNQTQITRKEGGYPFFVSPDGNWVYYHHGLDRTLWRVSTESGEEQSVINKGKYWFALSPDGSQVAFSEKQAEERILTIVSPADGQTVKTFRLSNKKALMLMIEWMPDGKTLAYITTSGELQTYILWLQALDSNTPQQIAVLGNEEIASFAVAPDGKTFAVAQGSWKHDAVLLKGLR